jgi:hypothetical protein
MALEEMSVDLVDFVMCDREDCCDIAFPYCEGRRAVKHLSYVVSRVLEF